MFTYLFNRKPILLSLLLPFFLINQRTDAQVRYTSTSVDLTINGTSTLHDWSMNSVKAQCEAILDFNAAGQITGARSISFSTPANALKSEHTSMDNNAYKALKADKDPLISFTATSVNVAPATGSASTVTVSGKLTIAGMSRDAKIIAVCQPNGDNTISVSGKDNISMKDFSIDPPTFMLGTIKTGNDIILAFQLTLRRS